MHLRTKRSLRKKNTCIYKLTLFGIFDRCYFLFLFLDVHPWQRYRCTRLLNLRPMQMPEIWSTCVCFKMFIVMFFFFTSVAFEGLWVYFIFFSKLAWACFRSSIVFSLSDNNLLNRLFSIRLMLRNGSFYYILPASLSFSLFGWTGFLLLSFII